MEKILTANSTTSVDERKFDTNLYSRQIGAFGLETMGKLIKMKVLISGLNGAGVETAKNLILAGPHTVALHDDSVCHISDMASNFYIAENDVLLSRTRAQACLSKLGELNDYVSTEVIEGKLTTDILRRFDVIVVCDMPRSEMISINSFCRSQQPPIGFISMDGFGLTACVFVDFGPEFTVFDKDGNPLKSALIENIDCDNFGKVSLHPDKISPFETGDYVVFKEVEGMTEINGIGPFCVTRTGKHSFTIGNTAQFSPYTRQGIVEEKKMPFRSQFQSLETSIAFPLPNGEHMLPSPDLAKIGRSEQLHYAIQSVYEFRDTHGVLPPPRDTAAVQECLEIATRLNDDAKKCIEQGIENNGWRAVPVDTIDSKVLENVVMFAACHISPIAAFLGGVVAQEVVKFTGKFLPLRQWLYFDAFEALLKKEPSDTLPQNSRYDPQLIIWGNEFQKKLGSLKIFLVGAGALGCEYMKTLALMGCCTSPENGCVTITDMDRIEVSNLNRQFLFRRQHVGAPKALTAGVAAKEMNRSLVVHCSESRVGPETETEFNDNFWESLDIVVNALDNIQSRLYVDGRCVWYHKPLLESGTLGTKANVQVIIPKMTQSYGDSQDPPEESIPLCTLRHFPNQIEHTIEWARDAFQGLFCDGPQEAKSFLSNPEGFLKKLRCEGTTATQRSRLEKIHMVLSHLKNGISFLKCVEKAVHLFTMYFDHQICQLLYSFPLDHVTSDGLPFWSGPKRPPQPLTFSPDDPLHLAFITASANLEAFNLGLPQIRDINEIQDISKQFVIEPFVPKEVRFKTHEKDTVIEGSGDDDNIRDKLEQDVLAIAISLKASGLENQVNPIEFEKDDETNFHIEFIWACANLRARNYKISECDRYKAQMIAGKIIPAIATTTGMVTGLASLELIKMVTYPERTIEDMKNGFINLALPLFIFSEPLPPIQTKSVEYDALAGGPVTAKPDGFTTWDVMEIQLPSNGTVQQLIEKISILHDIQIYILSVGNACLYNGYLKTHQERLKNGVKELTERITKTPLPKGRNYIAMEASCSDADGGDVIVPTIKVVLV